MSEELERECIADANRYLDESAFWIKMAMGLLAKNRDISHAQILQKILVEMQVLQTELQNAQRGQDEHSSI